MSTTKFIKFSPDAVLAPGADSGWIRILAPYDGTLTEISGSVIDPAVQASSALMLEKLVEAEYTIDSQSQTGDATVRISSLVGLEGGVRPITRRVEKGTPIEVFFENSASAGASLMPELVFRLEAD